MVILLSEQEKNQYMRHGSSCERIVWVRLKGSSVNLFIVSVYLPHNARVTSCFQDTMEELTKLTKQIPKNDYIILIGDFNVQLPRSKEGLAGKWSYIKEASKNADSILNLNILIG